jgi:hypothetical protein
VSHSMVCTRCSGSYVGDIRSRYCSPECRKAAWDESDVRSRLRRKQLPQSPHAWTAPEAKRFWDRVVRDDEGCWTWLGGHDANGYSKFAVRGFSRYVHRLMHELLVGSIPDGLELDHLCRNTGCIRPDHLEAVTHRENLLRGAGIVAKNAQKTHCINGHEYTPENTYWRRDGKGKQCRACCFDRAYERLGRERV